MAHFWRKYSPYWHICVAIIGAFCFAILKYGQVDGYEGRIDKLETVQTKQEKKITRTDYNVQMIARKIGIRPLVPEGDDE